MTAIGKIKRSNSDIGVSFIRNENCSPLLISKVDEHGIFANAQLVPGTNVVSDTAAPFYYQHLFILFLFLCSPPHSLLVDDRQIQKESNVFGSQNLVMGKNFKISSDSFSVFSFI
jgi:hypothetical protein